MALQCVTMLCVRVVLRSRDRKTPCGYCFQEWATGYDHLIPRSHGGGNSRSNLYPCCKHCNSILSNLIFDSIEEKREYARRRLIKRGEWKVPEVWEGVPESPPSSSILLPPMQVEVVGREKPENTPTINPTTRPKLELPIESTPPRRGPPSVYVMAKVRLFLFRLTRIIDTAGD